MLSVSKTSVPFNYQLTVSRVYEEGDANILDEDDDEGMFVSIQTLLEVANPQSHVFVPMLLSYRRCG